MSHTIADRRAAAAARLERHGQAHVLHFLDRLDDGAQAALLDQIDALSLEEIDRLVAELVRTEPSAQSVDGLAPAPYYPVDPDDSQRPWNRAAALAAGEDLIRAGRMAAFTVAGGQGTRLGWKGPKGTYPATVVTGKPLFRVFAEQIQAAGRHYGVTIPWYIMTSPINDAETRAFFADNNHFGLRPGDVFMFPQGVMPSLGLDGRLLLESPGRLAVNPDGHGGSIRALATSGAVEDMAARGIEVISYFQVDNPLVRIVDPVFLGLHASAPDSSGEMSSKMVAKAEPGEKVGVFCTVPTPEGPRTGVVEYSDLPDAVAAEVDADGRLRFLAGSIAIHAIGVEFVRRLTADPDRFALPFHRALKKVPFIDLDDGERREPSEPNAVKLETFVFDAIPLASSSIVVETRRRDEFAPIKNADGVDSAASSHQLQSDRAGDWLESCGVTVPRRADGHVDARLEISPLTALDATQLADADLPESIAPGEELVL